MKLSGNTILITGGASGIGLEFCKEFLKRENTVILCGRNKEKLEKIKKEFPKIFFFQSDVSQLKDIRALYEQVIAQFPQLNVLINNAGIMREINFHSEKEDLETLTQEIDTNLKGPIWMSKQFLPHLKKQPSAAIVNVSSGLAFVPLPISPVYCATKAALHSFSLSLRAQLKHSSVKVFEVAPPATETELLSTANPEDMKGVSIMKVDEMVKVSLKGFEQDRFEIKPGQSSQLYFMNRLAPSFILKQMSKTVDRMLR